MFLDDYQIEAVNDMSVGCILNGSVGSGKSRTGLYFYFTRFGGEILDDYRPMSRPKDLYIITTAMKRDKHEWEEELIPFLLSTNPEKNILNGKIKVVIDSWNNIKKYIDVKDAFFIFDEDRVTGSGVWVKCFYKITAKNDWIILSATAGDTWIDYIPVFIANGYYRNKSEFIQEHVVYARYSKYPKIERFLNTGRLQRLREQILVDMNFTRDSTQRHHDIPVEFDRFKYKEVMKTRWDPYKHEPIQQASGLCYVLRKVVNTHESRAVTVLELCEKNPRVIIFYNFDYELDILRGLYYGDDVAVAEWNGHKHEPVPDSDKWVYLVNYSAGAEGWNCIKTDTMIFFSQNYSYKVMQQAAGRIDRRNTPYKDLHYYHLRSKSAIDVSINRALQQKKNFNESRWGKWINNSR